MPQCVCSVNMAFFCSSLMFFSGMLHGYCLNYFEMVPAAPIITAITFARTLHMCCISIVRSLYYTIFSASFCITFPLSEIATYINTPVPFTLSLIMMSGLLLGMVLSVCSC